MNRRLKDNINSKYFEAANRLKSKTARRRIVAYVESYDDVLFWRNAWDNAKELYVPYAGHSDADDFKTWVEDPRVLTVKDIAKTK